MTANEEHANSHPPRTCHEPLQNSNPIADERNPKRKRSSNGAHSMQEYVGVSRIPAKGGAMRSDRNPQAQDGWVGELCHALGELQDLSDVKRFLGALLLSECVYKQPDTDVALYLSLFQAELGPSLAPLRRVQCSLPHVLHRYILAEGSGQLWVVFAGTKHRRDLLADANFALSQLWGEEAGQQQPEPSSSPAEGGDASSDGGIASGDPRANGPAAAAAAHTGFLSRSQGIPIEEIYEHAVSSGLHLVLCGHSLGGAVAKLCALRLLRQLRPDADVEPPPITCITFACTAVGNRELGAMVDKAGWSLHFRNYLLPEDMVPRLLGMSLAAQTAAATAASSTGDEQQQQRHGVRGRTAKTQGGSADAAETSSSHPQPKQSRIPRSAWRRMMALVPHGIVKLQQQELRDAMATDGRKGGGGARGMPMAEVEEAVKAEVELAAEAEEAAAAAPSGITGPSSAATPGIAVAESRWGALRTAMQMAADNLVRNTVPSYALFGHQYFLLPDEGAVPLRSIAQLADPKLVVQPLDDAAAADPRHRLLKSAAASVAVAQRRGMLELRNGFVHHRMFSYRGRVMAILASVPGCLPQPGAPTPEVSHMVVLATNIAPRVTATAALAMAPLVPPPRPVQFATTANSASEGEEDALPFELAATQDSSLDPQPRTGSASWFGAAGRTRRSPKIPGALPPAEEAPTEAGERAPPLRLVVPVVVFGKGVDVCNCAAAEVLGSRLIPVQTRLPLAPDSATKGSTAAPQRRRLHQIDRRKDDRRVQITGVRGVLARTAKAASLTFGGLTTGGAVVSLESSRSLLDPKLAPRSRNWMTTAAPASPSTAILQSLPVTITMPCDSVHRVLDSVRPGQPSKLQLSLKSDFHSREIGVSFLPWKVALLSSPSCTGSGPLAHALSSLCSRTTGAAYRPREAAAGLSPQPLCQAAGVQWLDLTTQAATLTRWRGRLYRFAQRLQSTCSLGSPVRSGLAATQHYGWSPVLAGSALAEAYTAAATGGAAGLAVWGGDTLLDALSGLLAWGSEIRAKAARTTTPPQAEGWDPPAGAHAVVILHDAMQAGINSPGDQHLVRDAARAARYAGLPVVLAVLGWEELHGSNKALAVGLLRDYYGLADIRSSHVIGIGRWTAAQTAKQGPGSGYGSSTEGANTPLWSSAEPRSRHHQAAVGVDISEADAQILREKVHAVLCGLPPPVQPKP